MKLKLLLILFFGFIFNNISAQVTANFVANTTSGCPNPLLVIINSTSTNTSGGTLTYNWQLTGPAGFTTLSSSTNQISTSLSIPGFYSVSLTVCNSAGVCNTKVETNYIQIFNKPSYSYTFNPANGCAPQQVCFDGTINPGCGTVSSVIFDSKDGIVYNTEDFCHTYNNPGNYTGFTVSIQNSCGCVITENIQDTIKIRNNPVANFTANQNSSCTAPLNVTFTNTSNTLPGSTYIWNIPGLVNNVTSTNLTQSFAAGVYSVELIVVQPGGCRDTLLKPNFISVGNPIANFSANNVSVCEGGSIQFNNLSSGSPISYAWQVIGGAAATGANPIINFATAGVFDVRLTTTYAGGCSDVELKTGYITVRPKPTNSLTVSDSSSCLLPFTTTFNATSTNSVNTKWTFPGGSPAVYVGAGPVNVTYNTFGFFNVTMSDTSSFGCTKQTTFNNVVHTNALTASIVGDTTDGCAPINSYLSVITNGADPIASYSWSLPGSDILTSTAVHPNPSYISTGCFDVSINLTSASGCTFNLTRPNFICAGTPPIASFSFTPPSTCFEVDDICFTFTGSGADSIRWNFDDGPVVWTGPNGAPCHSYNSDIGDYYPSLIAYNNGCPNDTLLTIDTVQILGPVAVFTSAFQNCTNWNTINFTNTSVEADSSFWVFSDPSVPAGTDTSMRRNPSWTYPTIDSIKVYSVTLHVFNFTTGCDHMVTNTVTVYPPDANFTVSNTIGCAPMTVTFQNTSLNPAIHPWGWHSLWNWVGTNAYSGPGLNTIWGQGHTITKIYNSPGIYSVSLRNLDKHGCWDTISKPNLITVHGVITGFNADVKEGCFPLTVNFIDTSFAPVTYVASWHWNFGTGNPADTSNLQNPTFVYNNPGKYTVSLMATDSFGCVNTKTITNYVYVHNPIASFSLSDTFICNNQTINITNLSTGDSLDYDWQFQNATPASYTTNGIPPTLNFSVEGIQNLYLEVTDNFNCTADTTLQISVFDVVADGSASANSSGCPNPPLLVNFTNNSYNNVDSSSILWNFGNGSTSTDYSPSVLYSTPGQFIVTLSVSSLAGCADTTIVDTINIDGPWGTFELLDNSNICNCDSVSFAITTLNAATPTFITGDGQAIPYIPNGVYGDTIIDTLRIEYCGIGNFGPSLYFSEGACSYSIQAAFADSVKVDTIVPNFNFSNSVFCDTGTVCFTDSSYNRLGGFASINSWHWSFGTGNIADTSNIQNPCFFYDTPGTYNVCLDVRNINGCLKTYCETVIIRATPNVLFGTSDTSICINNSILFFDSTTVASGANITNWHWDFGTGNAADTSIIQNPSFNYTSAGIIDIVLNVVDNFGCLDTDTQTVQVFDIPTVSAFSDTIICRNDSVQLLATGALNYTWSPSFMISDTSIASPFVMPNITTSYFVSGIDINGCVDRDTVLVQVSNVFANYNYGTACAGDTVFFNNLSTSNIGAINSWSWNFNDPLSGLDSVSLIPNPFHIFNTSGNYNVSLTVQNTLGCSDDTLRMVGVSVPPLAVIDFDSACVNTAISFSSLNSLSGSGNITVTSWNFGTGNAADTSNNASPSFTYTSPGLYTVCLTINTDLLCAGNSHDTCVQVLIYSAPQANETIDTVCLGNANVFNDLSIAGTGNIISNYWSFGQNASDTALILSNNGDTTFQYNTYGNFNIVHIVKDDLGCEDVSTKVVKVYDNPVSNFSYTTACINRNNPFVSISTAGLDGINAINNYTWNFDEGAGFVSGTTPQNFNFANTGNHNISLAIIDAFGCVDTFTQVLSILAKPDAIINLSTSEVCAGLPITLDASSSTFGTATAQYSWDQNYNTGIDNTTVGYTFNPSADAQIMLVIIDGNNCVDTAFAQIVVHPLPNANFTASNGCVGIPIDLNSTSTIGDTTISNYQWIINSVASSGTSNSTFTPINASNLTAQLYITDYFNCSDSSVVKNLVVDTTVSTFIEQNDTIICSPTVLNYSVSGSANSYTWKPSNIFDNANLDIVSATISQNTSIIVTGSSLNNLCPQVSDTVRVILVSEPTINYTLSYNPVFIGLSTEIELDIIPFNNLTDSVLWEANSELSETQGLVVEATPNASTDYPFSVVYYYDTVRCQVDSFVNIQVIDECSDNLIYAPNVFTPNNDGQNDVFKITGISVDYFTYLRIFDRWGKLVFEKTNIDFKNGRMKDADAWDGNNLNGNYCNNGVYVFMYEGVCLNGEAIISSGNLTLIR